MSRKLTIAALLALAPAPVSNAPAVAQSNQAQAANPTQCQDTAQKKAKRSMLGGVFAGVAGGLFGGMGGTAGTVAMAALPAGTLLTDELLKMLDCKEQQKAAQATNDAIRGGVGTEVAWKSETRANVSGKSTVTGEEKLADGGNCYNVTDVVIVDGEETTVSKKMCRAKGANGYARV